MYNLFGTRNRSTNVCVFKKRSDECIIASEYAVINLLTNLLAAISYQSNVAKPESAIDTKFSKKKRKIKQKSVSESNF
jgi:hypothetical protein